jgi:UDP-N-acetylmuramate: L-alanyl-gamma-D-glutamyl-meso-diaminopimelate ligase
LPSPPVSFAGKKLARVHFIGIAGAGMSAAAKLLVDRGVAVTGSDEGAYPPVSDFLHREGIPCRAPYAAANLPHDADLVIIGKNARLVPETNAEVAAAYAGSAPVASFPELIGALGQGLEPVVVAGSYGKSTCAALLAHCLSTAGAAHDPSWFIGAIPLTPSTSARMGQGPLFVIEGDEYPSSNTDGRSKFLHYRPRHLLVTPLAHDHINVFPTPEDYLAPFADLAALPPEDAAIVACVDGELSGRFLAHLDRPVVTYGLAAGDYQAADIDWGERTRFALTHRGRAIAALTTAQLGAHNIENIVGVAALLLERRLLAPEEIATAVATFRGIKRRLDRKSENTALPIFEGFGSSHEKALSAIAAMKRHFPDRRLLVVFEPHAFSWRNRQALPWYDDVFQGAGKVFIYGPAAQGAATHAQLTHAEIVDRVRASGIAAEPIAEADAAVAAITAQWRADDVVLLLSSGPLGGLAERLPGLAERQFPT